MTAVTAQFGASPQAFIIVPLVGAFFIDIANALVIQRFLALIS
jgi:ESS family glutamate:Na+ symporter